MGRVHFFGGSPPLTRRLIEALCEQGGSMGLSLIAAFISLFFLVADPIAAKWNKKIYQRDRRNEPGKEGSKENTKKSVAIVFNAAMRRRKHFKSVSLFFLIMASLLTIYSMKEEGTMSENKFEELAKSLNTVNQSVNDIGGRIKKIEDFLWGRGGSGESRPDDPNSPSDGPNSGYLTIDERFNKLEKAISDLGDRAVTQEELEEIREEIIELRQAVAEYEKLMEQIGGMPAG